jgi:hypothetical protein
VGAIATRSRLCKQPVPPDTAAALEAARAAAQQRGKRRGSRQRKEVARGARRALRSSHGGAPAAD